MATHGIGYWYVEIEKQAFWRGQPHTWVNRYVMSGDDPAASDAASVIGILKGIEDTIMPNTAAGAGVGFISGRAYGKNGGTPITTVDYNITEGAGTATGFTGGTGSGANIGWAPTLETCLLITTRLNGLSSTGKPIFLRKYFRGITVAPAEDSSPGVIPTAVLNYVNGLVTPWQTGMGANNWVVIGTSGKQAAAAPKTEAYLSNRQVPKGRKRKSSSSNSILSAAIQDLGEAGAKAALAAAVAAG